MSSLEQYDPGAERTNRLAKQASQVAIADFFADIERYGLKADDLIPPGNLTKIRAQIADVTETSFKLERSLGERNDNHSETLGFSIVLTKAGVNEVIAGHGMPLLDQISQARLKRASSRSIFRLDFPLGGWSYYEETSPTVSVVFDMTIATRDRSEFSEVNPTVPLASVRPTEILQIFGSDGTVWHSQAKAQSPKGVISLSFANPS